MFNLLLVANWQPLATALPKPRVSRAINVMRQYAVAMPAGTLPLLQNHIDGLFMDRMHGHDPANSALSTSQLITLSDALDLVNHPYCEEEQNVIFEGTGLMPLHVLVSELLPLLRRHGQDAAYEGLMELLLGIPRSVAVVPWCPFGRGQ